MSTDWTGWLPTPTNINALPEPVRCYVRDLETNCDPAGIIAENTILKDQMAQLNALLTRRPLVSLQEHDESARKRYEQSKTHKTGIACPSCGEEVYDTEPHMLLLSSPPQKLVACKCGWKGTRVA